MSYTSPEIATMITARYAAKTGAERVRIVCGMFNIARSGARFAADSATAYQRHRYLLLRF